MEYFKQETERLNREAEELEGQLEEIDCKLDKKFCFRRKALIMKAHRIECLIADIDDEIKYNKDLNARIAASDKKIADKQVEAEELIEILRQILHNQYVYATKELEQASKEQLNRVLRWQNNPFRPEIK